MSRLTSGILAPVTGVYYLVLDVWGEKWAWVKNNIETHEKVFLWTLAISLFVLFLRTFQEEHEKESDESANKLLSEFIFTLSVIVEAKKNRFKTKYSTLKATTNKFSHITQPDEQIGMIFVQSAAFLQKAFDLTADELDMTVMRRVNPNATWEYAYSYQKGWVHTQPSFVLTEDSAAKRCLETGEPAFFPDKIKASEEKKYWLSNRDKRRIVGSAYVYPVRLTGQGESQTEVAYVISFITYGKQFCDEWDETGKLATTTFLSELCRRIELELCLQTIKQYQAK